MIRIITILISLAIIGCSTSDEKWLIEKSEGYQIHFSADDADDLSDYKLLFENGISSVREFFQDTFKDTFDIYIHPNRASLDQQWQTDWNMPDFNSQCWMVASGVANKFDLIAPAKWENEACEHSYANRLKTQRLITHELVHVYHGQLNKSPDFSEVYGIDWFVEGLATFASGQCDSTRVADVQKAINEGNAPGSLDSFWKGNLKYGLSGTMVWYMDDLYGRTTMKSLLPYNQLETILDTLNTSEAALLDGWEQFVIEL